jgi:hypothetical protein
MDWLGNRQSRIEKALAKRHLHDGTLVPYDVSSSYFEGRHCPLAKIGHSRDGKKGTLQIVFGLLCSADGCAVAIQVCEGNTSDPTTLKDQIEKVRTRFGRSRVVFVADRGLLTSARIRDELAPVEELDWVNALRSEQIRKLAEDDGPLQLSLFDHTDIAEIRHPDFPSERLVACFNPLLAAERARKREDLLQGYPFANSKFSLLVPIENAISPLKRESRSSRVVSIGSTALFSFFLTSLLKSMNARSAISISALRRISMFFQCRCP